MGSCQETGISRKDLLPDPFRQFDQWYKGASKLEDREAMVLATASLHGRPSCRTVLLKEVDDRGFLFYTNYTSRKAKEMAENPFGAITFYWRELGRQVLIEGTIEKVSQKKSRDYFLSRSYESQISALASRQDAPLSSRKELDDKYIALLEKYRGKEMPSPDFWGGYRLIPTRFEFLQLRPHRLHDRFEYVLEESKGWKITRLSP